MITLVVNIASGGHWVCPAGKKRRLVHVMQNIAFYSSAVVLTRGGVNYSLAKATIMNASGAYSGTYPGYGMTDITIVPGDDVNVDGDHTIFYEEYNV